MLVLTRKVGEGIAIGDDVKVIVMQIKGKQVRLGIKASPSTAVHREEVYQKIKDENLSAAMVDQASLRELTNFVQSTRKESCLHSAPLRTKVKKDNPPSD